MKVQLTKTETREVAHLQEAREEALAHVEANGTTDFVGLVLVGPVQVAHVSTHGVLTKLV